MTQSPFVIFIGMIATVGLGWLTSPLDAMLPGETKVIAGVAAIVVGLATFLEAYFQAMSAAKNAAKAPATAIMTNAPIVNEAGQIVAHNVTTNTTEDILAQSKKGS